MHWTSAKETLLATWSAQARIGVITDVDGTISHIVNQPDAATVTPGSRAHLRTLHNQIALVAVVSGRAAADVRRMVDLPELHYVGNHGLEWWVDGGVQITPEAAQFRPAIEAALAEIEPHIVPGMIVEDKGATLSVHYRQTASPTAMQGSLTPVLEQIAGAHHLKLFQGRMIFELRPPVEVNKGTAFRELVTRHALDGALYIGDDTTDVDALRMARELRSAGACYALAVGVEANETPAPVRDNADLLVSGVDQVEAFLGWLVEITAR